MNIKLQSKLKWRKNKGVIGAILMISFMIFSPTASRASSDTEVADIATILQQKTVTLNIKDKPIRFILNEIKKQTGIGFIIKDSKTESDLAKLSISVSNISVEKVLETLLKTTGYKYSIENNVIMIDKVVEVRKRPTAESPKIAITGTIINDEDHKPIAGATIIVEGTSNGAISDMNGKFTLNASEGNVLSVSYVGKVEQKFVVKDNKPISIILKSDAMAMDDVVVTGFGDVKRSSYTGNAVVVKREELLKVSKTNVIKALQSFDPSFRIKENTQWGSDPNALPEVSIRGESSIGTKELDKSSVSKSNLRDNPNLPTFIMDGFEISVTKLYDYDPNRIESITILKDAAATALYGSRAANGVVIIKTVAPKAGRVTVSYNFVADVTSPDLSDYNLMNAEEKLRTEKIAGCYELLESDTPSAYYKYQEEYNAKLANVQKGIDTYWLSKPLQSIFNHKHSLYVDGGSENLRFGVDLQYTKQDGVMKGSARDRVGAGFFLQYNYKTLTIRNNTTYLSTNSKESEYGNFSDFTKQLPYDLYVDDNGRYSAELENWDNGGGSRVNPMYEPSLRNFNKSKSEEFVNNLLANWYIIPGLLLKGQLSLTKSIGSSDVFLDPLSKRNDPLLSVINLVSGQLDLRNEDSFSIDMNATLSYNKLIKDDHQINLLLGVNMKENIYNNDAATYRGFPSGVLSSPNYAKEMVNKTAFDESTSRMVGVLASLNYSFRDIYMLDGSFRIDGSSAFGSEKRFAPFWSAGVGINIHKYTFMKNVSAVNLLKIRGSYGQTGKANFPAYAARTSYKMFTDDWYKTGYGVVLQAMGNQDLKWETTNTLDVGFETSLFNNLLYLKASYYSKTTIDLINEVTIPSATGFTSYRDNVGEVSNKGYEVDFRISPIRKENMNLVVNFNLAHNKNTIEKISESLKAYNQSVIDKFLMAGKRDPLTGKASENIRSPYLQYVEGGSQSSIFGVESYGINPANGEEVFRSLNGGTTNEWNVYDQVIVGNKEPKVQGNFGFNFQYKQFSIYTSFMYELGGQRYNETLVNKVEEADIYGSNVDRRILTGRWQKPGDNAKYKSLKSGRSQAYTTKPTSRFVQDYNVIDWSSVELSYDLSSNITKKLHVGMLRFTVGMNDIFHLSSVEQERGLSYPYARTVNFSVKITL